MHSVCIMFIIYDLIEIPFPCNGNKYLHSDALKHDLNLMRGYYNSSEYFICLSTGDLILNSKNPFIGLFDW